MPNPQSNARGLEKGPGGSSPRKISQRVLYSDFTKSSQYGILTMNDSLPEGAIGLATKVTVNTAFNGGTNNLVVGKSSGEDEFSDGTTIAVGTVDVVGDSFEDPCEYLAADTSVYLRIDEGTDWDDVTAGDMTVELFYISTVIE